MNQTPVKVLVADDDPEHRQLLVKALKDAEPSLLVSAAASVPELFRLASDGTYDCLVVDCNMPPFSISQIIKDPALRAAGCGVIAISGLQEQSVVIDSLRGGAVDFVPKSEALAGNLLWTRVHETIEKVQRARREREAMEEKHRRLQVLCETDPLTGLANRRSLERRLSPDRRAGSNALYACILLDLDCFKAVNDQFGHAAGDAILKGVGRFLKSQMKLTDRVFRWGGEEFLLLRESAGLCDAYLWADDLRRKLSTESIEIKRNSARIRVTASLGVECDASGLLGSECIERADRAMYLAKTGGRNQVCTWPMVVINQALQRASNLTNATTNIKRTVFLEECQPVLRPEQKRQVTDHCERVAELAVELGRILRLPATLTGRLRIAGLLHDIGKCMLPADLFEKTGELTLAEWDIISQIPVHAARIGRTLGADPQTVDAITQRTVWFHPRQREVEENAQGLLLSSITRAADALTAMTSDRPYRKALSWEQAVHSLRSGPGDQFHPAVMGALQSVQPSWQKMAA